MRELIIYAVESSICLALLWGFYMVFLKNDTRHERNRLYLLISILLSALIPLIDIRLSGFKGIAAGAGIGNILLPEITVTTSNAGAGDTFSFSSLFTVIYVTGLSVTGIRFLFSAFRLLIPVIKCGNRERIIRTDNADAQCYSAFGYIFVDSRIPYEDASRMIAHERNHISRMHHADLILTGIIGVIQWFNPFVSLTRRSLQSIHEYQADMECIINGEEVTSYQVLLVSSALNAPVSILTNTFSRNSLLKNRIIMMTKKKSGSTASLKLIMAVPLVVMMIIAFSCRQIETAVKEAAPEPVAEKAAIVYDTTGTLVDESVFTIVEEMPSFPGGDTALIGFLSRNLKYPAEAKEKGIQGRVILRFVVDEQGNVGNIVVIRSVSPVLDQEACDIMSKCPRWIPGKQSGKTVKVYYSLPVTFKLN